MIARLAQVAIGIWLMIASEALDYGGSAQAVDRIFGPIAASLAFVAIWEVLRALRWAVLPVAAWLILAPMLLWYGEPAAVVNSVVCGAAMAALVPMGGRIRRSYGGGWRVLVSPQPGLGS